jgi:hypothetical protein
MAEREEHFQEYLSEPFIPEYVEGMKTFHHQLVELHINTFILERVIQFPFHLFSDLQNNIFFTQVFKNFAQVCVLIFTRMYTDQGAEWFTLRRFKNKVCQQVKEEHREALFSRIKEAQFDRQLALIAEKARNLRSEQIAHMKENIVLNKDGGVSVSFQEIQALKERLVELFQALSFEQGYLMLPLPYHAAQQDRAGQEITDIDRILDGIAERSVFLHLPENNPPLWEARKGTISEEGRKVFDRYRKKFGLSDQF